jgi:membrane protein
MDRNTRNVALLFGLGATVVLTRAVFPSLLTKFANAVLSRVPGFKGHIDEVELSLLKGKIGLKGLSLRQSGIDFGQSLLMERVALQLDWKNALKGNLVAAIQIDRPRLSLSLDALSQMGEKSPVKTNGRIEDQPSWHERIANLYPFRLTAIRLEDGEFHLNDVAGDRNASLRLEHLNLIGENITNAVELAPTMMSRIYCQARIMSQGNLALTGEVLPLAETANFNIDLKTEHLDLRELRSLINRFLEMDVRNGVMDLYVEAAARQGQVHGYAKPVFEHLEIEPPRHSGLKTRVGMRLAKIAAALGRKAGEDRIATRMSFDGPLNNPQIDLIGAATQFFRNAFESALNASIENRLWFAGRKTRPAEVEVVYRERRQSRIGHVLGLVKQTFVDWYNDNAMRMAASLSYYTMFSLAPLLIIVIAVTSLLLGHQAAQGQIMKQLEGLVGHPGAAAIQSMIVAASKPKRGLLAASLGVLTLLYGATEVLSELKAGLNTVWRTQEPGTTTEVVKNYIVFLGMILGIAFLLAVSLIINAVLSAAGSFMNGVLPAPETVLQAGSFLFPLIVITVLFAAIFKVLPNTRIRWRDVWIGGAVTAFLFSIGKLALGLYLGKLVAASVYGAAGSVLIVFLWVYYSGLILYLGAEFTRVYAQTYGSRRRHLAPA